MVVCDVGVGSPGALSLKRPTRDPLRDTPALRVYRGHTVAFFLCPGGISLNPHRLTVPFADVRIVRIGGA